jgi:3-phenylpropionate/trans-cinnamate dioxygenase ferredoxin reductase component
MVQRFVVVGASLAGGTAAAVLRDEGFEGDVVLVGEESRPPYERPPYSKEYLRGQRTFEDTLVRPAGFWSEAGIETRFGVRALAVDSRARVVELDDGDSLAYDALLVATGCRNRRLPSPGAGLEGVLDLRTDADADRIREAMVPGARAVVVGMGFIGCEVAASLVESGVSVTALEPLPVPLHRVLGEEIGQVVAGIHRDRGVEVVLGDGVAAFEGAGRVDAVVTSGGRRIGCDFAVVGVGVEPVTGFLAGSGVALDDGVVVDEFCRTNIDGIFAAGDVARHHHPLAGRHIRVEHWQNALKQGQAAARSMMGKGAPYDDVHWFWSDQYEHNIQYAGFPPASGRWDGIVVRGSLEERSFVAFFLQDGRVRAAVALDRGKDLRRAMPLVRAAAVVAPDRLRDESVDLRKVLS